MLQIGGWVGGWVGKIVIPMSEALRAADKNNNNKNGIYMFTRLVYHLAPVLFGACTIRRVYHLARVPFGTT
jgi:hypothetical protein